MTVNMRQLQIRGINGMMPVTGRRAGHKVSYAACIKPPAPPASEATTFPLYLHCTPATVTMARSIAFVVLALLAVSFVAEVSAQSSKLLRPIGQLHCHTVVQ